MQTIYADNTNQYVYKKLFKTDGDVYEGTVDGQDLVDAKLAIMNYKQFSQLVNSATVKWNDTSKVWVILVPLSKVTQLGTMILTVTGSNIGTNIFEINVDIPVEDYATSSEINSVLTTIEDSATELNDSITATVGNQIRSTLIDYDVVTNNDMNEGFANLINDLMNTEYKTGRSIKDLLRILDVIYTGTVINAGTGLITMLASNGDTVTIVGDNLGNRSNVVVDLP